jgi:5-methylcytosine-specific restriction enzyme B
MNYWIVSPNATKNPSDEPIWKNLIERDGVVFMGWDYEDKLGRIFQEDVQIDDIILVAQGANNNKRVFIAGQVTTESKDDPYPGAPRPINYRKLKNVIGKTELENLGLQFDGSAYGASPRPVAIYQLYPDNNPADKKIAELLLQKIKQTENMAAFAELLDLLQYKKQIILAGPPGTGKTYTAKQLASQLILNSPLAADEETQRRQLDQLHKSKQMEFVQFHPAYLYEDFVRGITASAGDDNILYEPEDKILAKFAKEATANYLDSKKSPVQVGRDAWLDNKFAEFVQSIAQRISDGDDVILTKTHRIREVQETRGRFIYSKNDFLYFSQIKLLYLRNITTAEQVRKADFLMGHVKHRTAYYFPVANAFRAFIKGQEPPAEQAARVELKPYVLIIDEINRANLPAVLGELIYALEYRGEKVALMYPMEEEDHLVLPPNLLIIGTMNTADRSVGHIDYAIRRRFAFVEMLPDPSPLNPEAQKLFKDVTILFISDYGRIDSKNHQRSEHLSLEFRPQDVWLGHSYFMTKEKEGANLKVELARKLKYEIIPLLEEYVKDGVLLESAISVIKELHV